MMHSAVHSAATYLRFGEQRYMSFVANFIAFLAVKDFWYWLRFGRATAR